MITPERMTNLLKNLKRKSIKRQMGDTPNKSKVPQVSHRKKDSTGSQYLKKKDSKKVKGDRVLISKRPNRITVQHRGIFSQMIRTNFLKKHFDSLRLGSRVKGDTGRRKTQHYKRVVELTSSSESDRESRKRSNVAESQYNANNNYSPGGYLADILEAPAVLKTPEKVSKIKTNVTDGGWISSSDSVEFCNDHKKCIPQVGDEEKNVSLSYKEIKKKVARIESCTPEEALQIFLYQEFTSSIKRVMIVERKINFEKFPDAMDELRENLSKLKMERSKQSQNIEDDCSNQKNEDSSPKNDDSLSLMPMDIDEVASEFPTFRRPSCDSPVFYNAPKKNERQNLKLPSRNLFFDDVENDIPSAGIFNFDKNVTVDDRQKCVGVCDFEIYKPEKKGFDKVAYKNVQKPTTGILKKSLVVETPIRHDSEFEKLIDRNKRRTGSQFPFNLVTPRSVPDTIDQNIGLEGVGYLKNVSENKLRNERRAKIIFDIDEDRRAKNKHNSKDDRRGRNEYDSKNRRHAETEPFFCDSREAKNECFFHKNVRSRDDVPDIWKTPVNEDKAELNTPNIYGIRRNDDSALNWRNPAALFPPTVSTVDTDFLFPSLEKSSRIRAKQPSFFSKHFPKYENYDNDDDRSFRLDSDIFKKKATDYDRDNESPQLFDFGL